MQETNGLHWADDIGGPMDLGSGYRWNVPMVTYGFDKSFMDYFGTNGVAAVESAIQILNDLPPASSMVLTNFPLDSRRINYLAQAQGLLDVKSKVLSVLIEQMGLAQPTRNIFVLRHWIPVLAPFSSANDWDSWVYPYFISQRNFDPQTFAASTFVNDTQYSAQMYSSVTEHLIEPFPVNPLADTYAAVAENSFGNEGVLYTGLTRDDVGGLRYLLSADNVNYEKLLPDVRVSGPHRTATFTEGWRPGVEKVTFVKHPVNARSRRFYPARYQFADVQLQNDVWVQKRATRQVREPDFLFFAADTGEDSQYTLPVLRTSTTNWLNNASWNGHTNGEGPGVIQPQIKITFHKLGDFVASDDSGAPGYFYNQGWGSFDSSTNLPIVYPDGIPATNFPLTIRLRFQTRSSPTLQLTNRTWHLQVPIGGQVSLQISTNQVEWTSLATVTNAGALIEWYHTGSDNPPKFFQIVAQ